jgi:hypothetical protein
MSALLPVDLIEGPVFLDCGTDDQIWGTARGCSMAAYDLEELPANSSWHVLYRFVGGGHGVNHLIPYEPTVAIPAGSSDDTVGVTQIVNSDADAILWLACSPFSCRSWSVRHLQLQRGLRKPQGWMLSRSSRRLGCAGSQPNAPWV